MEYKFNEDKSTMIITTKSIIQKTKDILIVSHDEDDGMWEFLDGMDVKEENGAIVSIWEIVGIDNSVNELFDLPEGWIAYRENKNARWIREKN